MVVDEEANNGVAVDRGCDPFDTINDYFSLGLTQSEDGGTVEGFATHPEDGGYAFELNSEDCEAIGNAFIDLAKRLNGWKRASELAKHLMGQNE